jgi:uncharacterized protein with HEPN domain
VSRKVLISIKDILENMRDAEEFIQGMSYEQFAADKKTVNVVAARKKTALSATPPDAPARSRLA